MPGNPPVLGIADRFRAADDFPAFLERAQSLREFWRSSYKRAVAGPELADRLRRVGGKWHLLVLNADWCGDSVNVIPYLARLVEAAPNVEMRLLDRDANLDLMDSHLTGKSRSIPRVIVYNERFDECGTWGPRPAALQKWVLSEGMSLPKEERYKQIRTWYARDHGVTAMTEIVEMMEGCDRGSQLPFAAPKTIFRPD